MNIFVCKIQFCKISCNKRFKKYNKLYVCFIAQKIFLDRIFRNTKYNTTNTAPTPLIV